MLVERGNISQLQKLSSRNLALHIIIENEVRLTPFGQMTFNVLLKDSKALIETLSIVKSRRKKYKVEKEDA